MRARRENAKPSFIRRVLACLVSAAMVVAFTPVAAWGAYGNVDYQYLDANDVWQNGTKNSGAYTPVSNSDFTWGDDGNNGWYVVNSNVTIGTAETPQRVTVSGDVHLILKDGCNLTVNGGIQVQDDDKGFYEDGSPNNLTIYGQQSGTGKLTVQKVANNNAGIGGNNNSASGGITINGGTVTATGGGDLVYGLGGAGIGGGGSKWCSNIAINGGTVTAIGGNGGAGIGSGASAGGGAITINGGTITATGGNGGAGIGGGVNGQGSKVAITGGTVKASGGTGGAGIGGGSGGSGGTLIITGGTFQNIIYHNATAGILPSDSSEHNIQNKPVGSGLQVFENLELPADLTIPEGKTLTIPSGKTLTIPEGKTLTNNGTIINKGTITGTVSGNPPLVPTDYVEANGTSKGPENAIEITESTMSWSAGWYVAKGDVTISQNVNFNGDVNLILADNCKLAVNGSIYGGTASSLTIYGQSTGASMGTINITGSISGGDGGSGGNGGNITISGGTVTATSIKGGSGGNSTSGVKGGNGGQVTITGGTVTATGVKGGDGGLDGGNGGSITISGGVVGAGSIEGGSGGRGGNGSGGGTVTINGGMVYVDGSLSTNSTVSGSGAVYYPLTLVDATVDSSTPTGNTSEYNRKLYGKAGGEITLAAGTAPAGKEFGGWATTPANITISDDTFTMPDQATEVAAQWRDIYVPPSDPSYNVPAAGEGGVAVKVTVSGSTAVVAEISASALESAAGSGAASITIDLSGLPKGVTQAQLSKTTVDKLLAVLNDKDNAVESVTVNLDGAVLTLDAKALAAVAWQTMGANVTLGVKESSADSLNSAQRHALLPFEVVQLYFTAEIKSGGVEIHDFGGGAVHVSVAFEPKPGHNPARYMVLYAGEDGAIERYATAWAAGMLSFTAPHFSTYAVVYVEDATQAAIDALEALPVAGKLKTSQAKAAVKKAEDALKQVAALDDGQKMLVDEALVANAESVVKRGNELVATADKKAVGKVRNKSFSVKAGKSKSIAFKTKASAAGTKVVYKKSKGSKYISVTKAGKVTAKKGMKAGKTYTAKVKVTCGKSWKYVKVTVKVRG